jgi:L-ascorbate metabolism protein UlaG (beta-lactamase superfamily)
VTRLLKRAAKALLILFIVLLLLPVMVPPFLDRIYYRGPVSGHFDGQRFFNIDGEQGNGGGQSRPIAAYMVRFLAGDVRVPWPQHVATAPGRPVPGPIDPKRMIVTWIGHSTVLVQAGGINILTDPIYAIHCGPWGRFGPKRVRDPGIPFDALPHIDLVLVSHDHWDHMDLPTLRRLWLRDHPLIVTSLGNDTVIREAGVPSVARDWGQKIAVRPGITVTIERVHHWGSRWMKDRDRALWSGFAVSLPGGNLFFAGDTGWGDGSWPIEDSKDGPYRLAIIPIGAFQPRDVMSGNHIGPVEAVAAFKRLKAAYAIGVHWGTFQLSSEGVDEPARLLAATLATQRIAPDRFRTTEVGVNWEVPALP